MISLKHVSKSFGPLKAVDDASLEVKKGEIICLIGPSGSGKSTLLRCIAGLEDPEEGEVWIDGERLDLHSKDQKKLEKLRIKMGFVFQHFNLFPHMTVLENLTLAPIQVLGMDKAAAEQRAMELLARVDEIEQDLYGMDCGACGAPSCRALATDIALGRAAVEDCIYIQRERHTAKP